MRSNSWSSMSDIGGPAERFDELGDRVAVTDDHHARATRQDLDPGRGDAVVDLARRHPDLRGERRGGLLRAFGARS